MAKPDIFDEIIACLGMEAEVSRYVSLSKGNLDDLFSDILPGGAAPRRSQRKMENPAPMPGGEVSGRAKASKVSADGSGEPHPDYSLYSFNDLRAAVASCTRCRLHTGRTNTVFGDGDEKAELMFIGEGPGADEDAQGLPFVGRAGELLTRMILAMQFQRKDVFIANIVKCRPPNNRAPDDDEAKACLPFLHRQIQLVSPKAIVLLGATPLKALMGKTGVTKLRGGWLDFGGIKVMPTFHPAFLLRTPPAKKDVWEDLQKVMELFGKVPPPRQQKGS